MPVFTTQLGRVEPSDPAALRRLANHIRYLQETLEYTLMNLDSTNITEIETDKTEIRSSDGSASFTGGVSLTGKDGASFAASVEGGVLKFSLKGKGGASMLYLTDTGRLVVTEDAAVTVDGGEW